MGEDIEEYRPDHTQGEVEKEEEILPVKIVEPPKILEGKSRSEIIESGRIKISPRAKNLALKSGVSYEGAEPTGPYGRIIERDIQDLIDRGPVPTYAAKEEFAGLKDRDGIVGTGIGGRVTTSDLATRTMIASGDGVVDMADYEEVSLTNIRRLIGESMHRSLQTTAQLTLDTTFDATDILEFRKAIKSNGEKLGLENITLNDIILFAVSRALAEHREMNAHFIDDKILRFNRVNLGVAVDTPRGLMVPTIFDAETKSLNQISKEARDLVDSCRVGSINPDKLKGGTFTVTNLGSLGIESFTPILNPPQVGILGVNTIVQRIRETEEGYEYYPAMGLSLTFDHRAVDGAPAARFLMDVKFKLESFTLLLVK